MKTDKHEQTALGVVATDAPSPEAVFDKDRDGGLGLADERILGEISHEMGNYFHKLYYWSDFLKERAGAQEAVDATAVEMLGATVERLEQFMRMILEYFAPPRLRFNEIAAADLITGLDARLVGRRLRVEGLDEHGTTPVHADPGLIGHAMRTVFECAAATLIDEDEMVVRLARARRRDFDGIEIELHAGRGAPLDRGLNRGIEMAVAEKFLQMHGGELYERALSGRNGRALVVFLPIYA